MSSNGKTLGVLMLSAARHQSAFARVLSQQPDIRLIALTDDPEAELVPWVREANLALAAQWNVPYIEDIDAALALPGVDIVTVCSQYFRHGPHALKALRAGKHVLLDKQPMGMSAEEGESVFAAWQAVAENGVQLSYIHHVVDPAVIRARKIVEGGEIGEPRAVFVSAMVTYGPGDEEADEKWFRGLHPQFWGGGELIHHGAYGIGVARYLMGCEITSVFTVAAGHFNRIHRENGSEDLVTVSLGFENGRVGTVIVGRAPNNAHPGYADEFANLIGTRGAVTADWEGPWFLLADSEQGLSRREMYGRADATELAILDFLRAVRTGGEPLQGPADGLAEVRALWAAFDSAKTGRTVSL